MIEPAYFPLDFDTLKKGDEISTEQIEEFGCCSRDDVKAFQLAALQLRNRVTDECRDRGKQFTVIIKKSRIRILTDEEAAIYNPRQFRLGFRKQLRSLRRLANVDTVAFSDEQKKEHERNLLVCGRMVQAARSARAAIVLSPHVRTIPGLPPNAVVASSATKTAPASVAN